MVLLTRLEVISRLIAAAQASIDYDICAFLTPPTDDQEQEEAGHAAP